ncbi:MAG: FMN-dependent NADH-azoreductase [Balneola sp.]
MKHILHIDTSTRFEDSISRLLSKHTVDSINSHGKHKVEYLDLSVENLPHLNQDFIKARYSKESDWTLTQRKSIHKSRELIQQIKNADIIIMGVAMYNFGIPSTLKAYFDHIVISGETFISNEKEEYGLLENKKAIIISACGGAYDSEEIKGLDHVNPFLRTILRFIGIVDIQLIKAQSTTYFGQNARDLSVQQAINQINEYTNELKEKEPVK